MTAKEEVKRFRPLAGIMVLISDDYDNDDEYKAVVSVPLRGLWFLSGTKRNIVQMH